MVDIPPVWLGLAIWLGWMQGRMSPMGLRPDGIGVQVVAGGLVALGLALILAAASAFLRHRTTIIPHQVPARLIKTGVFKLSRNPIYLGDAFCLAGCLLYLSDLPMLLLVPAFVWWITVHFIQPEEARMRKKFMAEFAQYEKTVRRWL